jgi:hypothetical protein
MHSRAPTRVKPLLNSLVFMFMIIISATYAAVSPSKYGRVDGKTDVMVLQPFSSPPLIERDFSPLLRYVNLYALHTLLCVFLLHLFVNFPYLFSFSLFCLSSSSFFFQMFPFFATFDICPPRPNGVW